jgi:hypothetical protein
MDKHDIDEARAVAEIEGRTKKPAKPDRHDGPAAGPHATKALTSHDSTPGAGALPDTQRKVSDIDGGVG